MSSFILLLGRTLGFYGENKSGFCPAKRGRKPAERNPLSPRVAQLEREVRQLEGKLKKAELILDIQKKVAALLGIPLNHPESGDSE